MKGALIGGLCAVALVAAACGNDRESNSAVSRPSEAAIVPVLASTDVAVGDVRLILTLREGNASAVFPAGTVFRFRYLQESGAGFRFRSDATARALDLADEAYYVATAAFDEAGVWAVEVRAEPPDGEVVTSGRLQIPVEETARSLRIGDAAPLSSTPTLADTPLASLTGDGQPEPALYETSIAEAIVRGAPFLLAFTTVDPCFAGALCQRALDQVKRLTAEQGVVGIHVEPLRLPAILDQWRLRNEPWLFVVDAGGLIVGSFELFAFEDELLEALATAQNHG